MFMRNMVLNVDADRTIGLQAPRGAPEFEALARAVPAIVFAALPDGGNVYVNRHFERYTGMSALDLIGRGWIAVVHAYDLAALETARADSVIEDDEYAVEVRLRRHDGVYRRHQLCAAPITVAGAAAHRWMGVATDVEDARLAAASSERAAALLTAIGDAVPDLIYAKDLSGTVIYASRGATRAIGAGKVVGRRASDIVPNADEARAHEANDMAVLASGAPIDVEEAFTGPDGTRRLFRSIKAPLRDSAGRLVGVAGITRDLTAEHERAAGLVSARAAFDDLANTMPFPVWHADAQGRLLARNESWGDLAGLPRDAAPEWSDLILPADLGEFLERWHFAVNFEEPFHTAVRIWDRATGGVRSFLAQALRYEREPGQGCWYGVFVAYA